MGTPHRVLVTRAAHQGSELAERLREHGLEPVQIPTIQLQPPSSWAPLEEALRNMEGFDWVLFTSANAVAALQEASAGCQRPPNARIAAIGTATAAALVAMGWEPDLVPASAVAESLAEALRPHATRRAGAPARFLLLRAEEGRDVLPDSLRAAGGEVTVVPVYRTVVREESAALLREEFRPGATDLAAITFTSSSTARNFFALCEAAGVHPLAAVQRVSIGPITSATLRELGFPPHAESPEASIAALAETVLLAVRSLALGGTAQPLSGDSRRP